MLRGGSGTVPAAQGALLQTRSGSLSFHVLIDLPRRQGLGDHGQ